MATTYQDTNGNGSNKVFNFGFEYLKDADVKVQIDQIQIASTEYAVSTSPTKITFNNNSPNTAVQESDGSPKNGLKVRVYRDTDVDSAKALFASGSTIRAGDLNRNFDQGLFHAKEQQEQPISTWQLEDGSVTPVKIKDGAARQLLQTNAAGNAVEWTNNIDVPGTLDVTGATDLDGTLNVDGATQLQATGVDGNFDINTNKFTVNASTGNTTVAGSLTVTGDFDCAAGSIDTAEIADNAIDGAKLATDIVLDTGQTIWFGHSDNNATGDYDTDTFSIYATADDTNNTHDAHLENWKGNLHISTSAGSVNINKAVGNWGESSDETMAKFIVDGAVELSHNNVKKVETTATGITVTGTADLDGITGDGVVTSGSSNSDTKVYSAKRSDEIYFNLDSGETIKSGDTWSGADTKIATTKAIDNRVVDLIDEVGGFLPLLNEGAIPATHPEAANETTADRVGTIISIGFIAKSGGYTPSGGTVTIPASELSNHSVNATITDCGTTVLAEGFGVLVETTAQTDSQYAAGPSFKFHRLTPKATEVTNVASKSAEITRLGTAAAVEDMSILGTTDCVADMAILGTADVVADLNTLGTADVVADLNTLATSDVVSDLDTCATNVANINAVGGDITNVNAVATNIASVHDFADLYQVKTSAPTTRADSSALVTGDLWFDSSSNKQMMVRDGSAGDGYSAMSPSQSTLDDIAVVSGNITYTEDLGLITDALTTGTGNSIETCADSITQIQTCHTNIANINAVAADATDIGSVAGKATEIGRLGTAAAVADLAILGTTDVVADMNTLATADVVSDMNTLATADIVSDMNTLATADIVSDMNTLATSGNVTAMDNCSGSISNINTVSGAISNVNTTATNIANVNTTAGISANVTTVAGISANVTTVAGNNANVTTVAGNNSNVTAVGGSISNVNTVAGSIANVNRYANEYKISANAPGSPSEGDLWYDDTNNVLKYRDDSSWNSIAAGIANIDEDTSPSLGGHLDCNDKNLTEVGTVSGNNLQIDFGTL